MSVKDEVLKQLENNKGNYISGGQLAQNLGVSRNSIWKAIKSLEKNGYEIGAIPNKGYCLEEKSDILSSYSIGQHLKNSLDIHVYSTVSSTNTILKEMAEQGACEGTVVIAEEQTAGKGRMGKSFYSPSKTGIYVSILLRPTISAEESLFLTTSAAVAVSKAIEDVSTKSALIKWVNDIYIGAKKVCGILTEGAFNIETNRLDYAIVGMGINVCPPKEGFPKELKTIATTVFDTQSESANKRSILIAHLLDYFMEYYDAFQKKDYVKEYIDRSFILGKEINIIEDGKTIPATAIEIDKKCRLKVQLKNGSFRWLSSGEVSIRVIQ